MGTSWGALIGQAFQTDAAINRPMPLYVKGATSTTNLPTTPALQYPGYGSVVSKEYRSPPGVPPYIKLNFGYDLASAETTQPAGYLGVAYNPFKVNGDPNGRDFSVRALNLPDGLGKERFDARRGLLEGLDTAFREAELKSQDLDGLDKFYQRAFEMLDSPKARAAFDLSKEPAHVRDGYGRHSFGQACLLARRLVEAGVRFVTINYGSWDAHGQIFRALKGKLPELDAGVAGLLEDLGGRGLLEKTAVLMTGEFGRTPKVNGLAGRDHWSRAMSVVMAGAGVKGRSSARPTTRPRNRSRTPCGPRTWPSASTAPLASTPPRSTTPRPADRDRSRRQGHQGAVRVRAQRRNTNRCIIPKQVAETGQAR